MSDKTQQVRQNSGENQDFRTRSQGDFPTSPAADVVKPSTGGSHDSRLQLPFECRKKRKSE